MSDEHRSFDPTAIAGGLQQLFSWAAQTVVGPHSAHEDPAEHLDCLVCRGIGAMRALGLDSVIGSGAGGETEWDLDSSADVTEHKTFVGNDEDVTWVRVKRERP